jgi:hypothetical protein
LFFLSYRPQCSDIYRGVCVFQTLPKEVIIVIIEKSTETMFLSELNISSEMAAVLIISSTNVFRRRAPVLTSGRKLV